MEEAQALLGVARLRLLAELGVVVEVDRAAAEPAQLHPHPRRLLAAEGQQRRPRPGQQAAREVGHGDDVELQPLGVVDGHDPHPVVALGGGRGLGLGVGLGAGGEEVEQAAQVAPSRLSNSAASRISLRTLAKRASPAGRISTARS